ncbi:MAG: divalent metal cation transporter [Patescibacteria group bacterium]|nr:divalent metal cation transporter [Patescibacteria group bacterium]
MIEKIKLFFSKFKTKLLIFLAVLGPGIITAVADNDAGGVATYTVGAAKYGMNSQFLIIPITIVLALTQEMGARIAIVTKKGLGDLIRERYGVLISLIIFILYFFVNQGVVLQNISGLKASFQIFNFPWQISLIITSILLIFFIIKFDYKKIQRIFLFMIIFYISYIISAILAKPNWGEALRQSLIFPDKEYLFDINYWFANVAVLGTTITAWGQFFVHSYIIDKKLDAQHLKAEKLEVYIGAFLTNFFSWMMAAAVTYTLFVNGIREVDGFNAGLAMKPFVGNLAPFLFGVGLFGASILGLSIVPLATAYVFSEMFGYEGSLNADFKKGRLFYSFFIIQIVIAVLIALIPKVNLFDLTFYVDYLNGAMLPIIFYFLIKFSEDEEVMGQYRYRGWRSIMVKMSAILIGIGVIAIFLGKLLGIE